MRPAVSLVGSVDADALFRRPHFRSAVQAYQACAYMAEWAGAAEHGGRFEHSSLPEIAGECEHVRLMAKGELAASVGCLLERFRQS